MTNDLVYIPPDDIEDAPDWDIIVNEMSEQLVNADTPDKVINAAILMISGWPIVKIADRLGVKPKDVKLWLSQYPIVTKAVMLAKQDMTKWRLSQMEQQFVNALDITEEVFSAKPVILRNDNGDIVYDEKGMPVILQPNAKLLGVQAQHARYVLGLFIGNKLDINVNLRDEAPVMKAKADALDYITKRLIEARINPKPQEETIVIVQDSRNAHGPMLDEEGNPNYGELGKLHVNEDGAQCHMCGQRFKQLAIHVRVKHMLSNEAYETVYMLPPGSLSKVEHDKTESNA